MRIRTLAWVSAVALVFGGCTGTASEAPTATGSPVGALEITGPYGHDNLQVWLVHGPDKMQSEREIVPLEEALERKLCIVHETGDVNELAIENVSDSVDVYVQSGDIVQGGKQDRTVGVDLVLAPHSGCVPLPSFCVEQGRWSVRGGGGQVAPQQIVQVLDNSAPGTFWLQDPAVDLGQIEAQSQPILTDASFSLSGNNVSTNALKKAVLLAKDQGRVWQEVANAQGMLHSNASSFGEVIDPSSPSSLELTLNTDAVKEATVEYVRALQDVVAGRDDVVGCVVAINGRLDSADVYGSRALFHRLWPKLLRGATTAAVAGRREDEEHSVVTIDEVRRFLAAPRADRETRDVGAGISMVIVETERNHVVESCAGEGALVHRIYLAK